MPVNEDTIALERGLLAVVLNNKLFGECAALLPDDFLDPRHQSIVEIARALAAAHLPFSPFTFGLELRRLGRLEEAGGVEYLAELAGDGSGDLRLIGHYVSQVAQLSGKRRLIASVDRLRTRLLDPTVALGSTLDEMRATIAEAARSSSVHDDFPALGARADEVLAKFAAPAEDLGLPTQIGPLDAALRGGLKPGQLIVVGGGTGSGKTSLGTQIALGAARFLAQRGIEGAVLLFSFEMQQDEIYMRLAAQVAEVEGSFDPPRGWNAADRPLAERAVHDIAKLPIHVLDNIDPTAEAIRSTVERFEALKGRVALVSVDHIHLLGAAQAANPTAALTHITRSLKIMAQQLRLPVLALAQVNREYSRRDNSRLTLSDLRQSGSIEQDADIVILIQRPTADPKRAGSTDGSLAGPVEVELEIAKHRAGPIGIVKATWLDRRTLFKFETTRDKVDQAATAAGPAGERDDLADRIVELVRKAQAAGQTSTRASFFTELASGKREKWGDWPTGQLIDRLVLEGRLLATRSGPQTTAPYLYRLPESNTDTIAASPILRVIPGGAAPELDAGDIDLEAIFG